MESVAAPDITACISSALVDVPSSQKLFFRLDRTVIRSRKWAALKSISHSVLPVLWAHCGAEGKCFPSERLIANLSGVSEKRLPGAIRDLESKRFLKVFKSEPNARGHRHNIYHLVGAPSSGNPAFMFHSMVRDSHWAKLTSRAHSLYVAMRCYGYLDHETHVQLVAFGLEGLETDDSDMALDLEGELKTLQEEADEDYRDVYRDRRLEVCDADLDMLMADAGMSRNTFRAALSDLEAAKVIIELPGFDRQTWAVALHQPFSLEPIQ